jgi:hypothetical protein
MDEPDRSFLKTPVHFAGRVYVLDIEDHGTGPTPGAEVGGAELAEFVVGHGEQEGVVGPWSRRCNQFQTVCGVRLGGRDARVVDVDLAAVASEFVDDVDDPGVTQVRAIFLEG